MHVFAHTKFRKKLPDEFVRIHYIMYTSLAVQVRKCVAFPNCPCFALSKAYQIKYALQAGNFICSTFGTAHCLRSLYHVFYICCTQICCYILLLYCHLCTKVLFSLRLGGIPVPDGSGSSFSQKYDLILLISISGHISYRISAYLSFLQLQGIYLFSYWTDR